MLWRKSIGVRWYFKYSNSTLICCSILYFFFVVSLTSHVNESSLQGCQRMTGLRKEECTCPVQLYNAVYTGEEVTEQKFSLTLLAWSVSPCNTRRINFFSSLTSLLSCGSFSGKVWTRCQARPGSCLRSGGHHLFMPRSRTLNSRNFFGSKF